MWLILQNDKPDDFVLAIEEDFKLKGFCIKWKGNGVNEIGYDEKTGKELICIDKNILDLQK